MFTQITPSMQVRSFGSGNTRIMVFRYSDSGFDAPWEQIPNTQVLLIGGPKAKKELQHIFLTISRPKFKEMLPDGISAGTHSKIREWLGLPPDRGRPRKDDAG